MAILSVIGPTGDTLQAVYKPVTISVFGTGNAGVFCDVYINNTFYKTQSATVPDMILGGTTQLYYIDIQNTLQEYLRSAAPPLNPGNTVMNAYVTTGQIVDCFVRVRGSTLTAGLIVPQGPIPVQGTLYTAPVSGGGYQALAFQAVNAALQHEDNQDLETHLRYFTCPHSNGWRIWQLSHWKRYEILDGDFGHIPIVISRLGLLNTGVPAASATLFMYVVDQNGVQYPVGDPGGMIFQHSSIYYIPYTRRSLQGLAGYGLIPWNTISSYQIRLTIGDLSQTAFISWPIYLEKKEEPERLRIRYMNKAGGYDSINFCYIDIVDKISSDIWQQSRQLMPYSGNKSGFGQQRFNVRSNEQVSVTRDVPERDMPLIQELFESPVSYLEWDGAQGQAPELIPIRITDTDIQTQKSENRHENLLTLTFQYANPNINLRN